MEIMSPFISVGLEIQGGHVQQEKSNLGSTQFTMHFTIGGIFLRQTAFLLSGHVC